jgi:hypothetical protein
MPRTENGTINNNGSSSSTGDSQKSGLIHQEEAMTQGETLVVERKLRETLESCGGDLSKLAKPDFDQFVALGRRLHLFGYIAGVNDDPAN